VVIVRDEVPESFENGSRLTFHPVADILFGSETVESDFPDCAGERSNSRAKPILVGKSQTIVIAAALGYLRSYPPGSEMLHEPVFLAYVLNTMTTARQ
jgi:hypothetical protein